MHMNQVHKESLSSVENALPDRQGLDVEIFGMEGIPEEVIQRHNQRIVQNFYQAQADRQTATGNPPSGAGSEHARKKIKHETSEELKARLHEYVTRRRTEKAGPAQVNPPFSATGQYPPPTSSNYSGFPPSNLPARPGSGASSSLPQRPQQYGSNWPPPSNTPGSSTLDELVGGAHKQNDHIDSMIRMAEAGIKPAKDDAPPEKKKKDKSRMVFADTEHSPEEILCFRYSTSD